MVRWLPLWRCQQLRRSLQYLLWDAAGESYKRWGG